MPSRLIRTIYDSQGHSGNTYYATYTRKISGKIWDNTNEELADNPDRVDSAVSLTETGLHGQFDIISPADLPAGNYDVVVYNQAGSIPQTSDDVELQFDVGIGGVFGF